MSAMSKDPRIKLGVLFGGRSGEHEVSLASAASVIAALDPGAYEIYAVGLTPSGRIARPDELRRMLPGELWDRVRPLAVLGSAASLLSVRSDAAGETEDAGAPGPDIWFPLLHGPYGEDGTLQGLLEMAGLPYIGCGVLASAVAMDKDIAKRLLAQAGLPVTPSLTVTAHELDTDLEAVQHTAERAWGYPMFSKPANLGSSVGVHRIGAPDEFAAAVRDSARYDRKILIEKGIDGRELECAILGIAASVVGEVVSAGEFYDYESKYVSTESRLEIPASIDPATSDTIRALALRAFAALDGSGLARVDFFLERGSGTIWINEINTMPGFTPISMYTKLWAATGVPFGDLVAELIRLGLERFGEKNGRRISPRQACAGYDPA